MTTTLTPKQKTLLDALHAFAPGRIYLLAQKEIVAGGFSLYRDKSVFSLGWTKDHSCLFVRVRGTRAVVNIFLDRKGGLDFSCTSCGTGCVHLVCALLTIKNLFQPELFRQAERDEEYCEALLAALTGMSPRPGEYEVKKEKPKGYEICVTRQEGGRIGLSMLKAGEAVAANFAWSVPALRDLWLPPYADTDQKLSVLIRHLERHENRYPLIIRDSEGDARVRFDPDLAYTLKTEVNVEGDTVRMTRLAVPENDDHGPPVLIGPLAYHPDTKLLGLVRDGDGWSWWRDLFRLASREETIDGTPDFHASSFQMPRDAFQRYTLNFHARDRDAALENMALKIDGSLAMPVPGEYGYRVGVTFPADAPAMALLRIERLLGLASFPPSPRIFSFFGGAANRLSPYLQAKKRRKVFCRAFFELAGTASKPAVDRIVKAAVADADIDKHAMRREAREFLVNIHTGFGEDDEQLLFSSGAWTVVAPDAGKELFMYRTLHELFGWDAFEHMRSYSEPLVAADLLRQRLPELAGRLAKAGLGLVVNGKTVRTAKWEFLIDATGKRDIDWFELRPEIRCDGRSLDGKALGALLETGVLEDEDCVRLPDPVALEALRGLAGLRERVTAGPSVREFIRVPRLQILDWMRLRGKGVAIKLPPEDEAIIERLLNFERIEHKPLPEKLRAVLRPYQRTGYDWLAFLYEHRFGACLADDMGLGKTLQAASLLAGLREGRVASPVRRERRPHLIVVPPSLLFNWEHELDKFCPGLRVMTYAGTERSADFAGFEAVLTTYGIVRRDVEILRNTAFDVIVFDEAQTVKNLQAGMTGAARRLNAYFKLVMTGTPLENHIGEYYSIIDLALPGLLGEYDEFRTAAGSGASPALDLLIRRTRPFVLRRTKEAVLTDLPPKTETDVYLDLTEEQKTLYTRTVEAVRRTIDDAYRDKTRAQANIIALTAILKLRQICVSPGLVEPDLTTPSPKTEFLLEGLRELLEEGHSALVFSQFTSFLDILEPSLKKAEIAYLRLDGSTPVAKRKALVKAFQSGEVPAVFLLSLKAGGKGLNLTRASYVFHLDPWWNPAVEDQASDRAHRIGQQRSVTITRVLMRHTIEEKMMELKRKKLSLYRAVMEGTEGIGKSFSITKEDFEFLLG